MKRIGSLGFVFLLALGSRLGAQVPLINDNFDDDPLQNDWLFNGRTVWVPPLDAGESCEALGLDPNNPYGDAIDDCTLYPDEGYILVTPGQNDSAGNAFRSELSLYDDFRMTVTVELRDGNIDHPADGMVVVIVGTDAPPAETGNGGGGMGAPCVGDPDAAPIMAFTFDNWECNQSDEGDINHVAFAYGAQGLTCTDAICAAGKNPCRSDRMVRLNVQQYPLNNKTAPPAPSNRYEMQVLVQAGTVACNLNAVDVGHDFGRVYTYKIPNFEPFEGYLGVTASTGGARQNHILHDAKIEALPEGFCLAPPALVERDITNQRSAAENCGDFQAGDKLTTRLVFSDIRVTDANCNAPGSVTVTDTPPAGSTVSNISDGGTYDGGTGVITWIVTTPALATGKVLTYDVTMPDTTDLQVFWSGSIVENIPLSETSSVIGEDSASRDTPFDACGGIKCWNILGGFAQLGGAGPGDDNIRLDYLTDGEIFEPDFQWYPGAQIATAFGGDGFTGSAAQFLINGARGRNPNGVPEVFPWNDTDAYINLNDDVFGGDPNNVMGYTQAYVVNTTGSDLDVYIGSSSDDSIQILLNGEEVWIHNIPRGGADACAPQDVSPDGILFTTPHILKNGENSLIVKTFEGGGGWNQAVRFQNDLGEAITEGLDVRKVPEGVCIVQPFVAARDIGATNTVPIEGGLQASWSSGEEFLVAISLSNIRADSDTCDPPTTARVEENVPAGWTVSDITGGGTVAGSKITWNLGAADITVGKVLGYRVKAPEGNGTVTFSGKIIDTTVVGPGAVVGETQLYNPVGTSDLCFINRWLLLGPYKQAGINGAAPGVANIQRDHLCDGADADETTITPVAGDVVNTTFSPGGCSRSTGLEPTARAGLNPDGKPTWYEWTDGDDTIDWTQVYAGDENQVMAYAVTYIEAETDLFVDIGLGSDDSVQVLLDGAEIHLNNIARGDGGANVIQDVILSSTTPGLNPLTAGTHQIMVKVFEGGGGHTIRLRFQDPTTGEGVCEGFKVCLNPAGCASTPPENCNVDGDEDGDGKADCADEDCSALPKCQRPQFHRGDADNNGELQLTDAIRVLGFLFLGGPAPTCLDAGDADNNDQLQLTDAIRILGFLFLGGPPPVNPGPPGNPCGPDFNVDGLGCLTYTSC